MGKSKTLVAGNISRGTVTIEISLDAGQTWVPVATFWQNDKRVVDNAAQLMRTNKSSASASGDITVAASDTGAQFAILPVPIEGAGPEVNISALGTFTTFTGDGTIIGASVNVQVSDDKVKWATCVTFTGKKQVISKDVVGRWARVFVIRERLSAAFSYDVAIGAIDDAGAAGNFAAPVTVEGSDNLEGVSEDIVRADHKHRLELKVAENDGGECEVIGQRPEVCLGGESAEGIAPVKLTITDNDPGDRVDVLLGVQGSAIEGAVDFGIAIPVRGPSNGVGTVDFAHADHLHRLELEGLDEGTLQGARPAINFIGAGVGLVDNPGQDRLDVTIPGNVTDGAVVKRSTFVDVVSSTTSNSFVDGMAGSSVTVPIDGDYWAIFEAECFNQSASGVLEIGISVNSVIATQAPSDRRSQGPAANTRPCLTTVQLPGLVAGNLVRALFRKVSGAGSVSLQARHLTIIKVQ
jgi:hypothetical protein